MKDIVKILPNFKKFNDYISNVKNKTNPIMLSGLTDSGKVHFAYSTYFYAEKPICIITYNELQAKKIIKNLEYFTDEINYFPKKEIMAYDYLAESKDITYNRIACLNDIYTQKAKIIVTTIEAVSQKIIPEEVLYKNILEFKIGDTINLDKTKQTLMALGYERQEVVENKSEFSVRGGIIDIAVSEKDGIRIELWGDEIDTIRTFDINTQRSKGKKEKVKIYPAHEFILDKSLEDVVKEIEEEKDKEEILSGNYATKIDKYWNSFYENPNNTFIDYIKDNYIIFLDEVSKLKARIVNVKKDTQNLIQNLIEKKRYVPQLLEKIEDYIEFLDKIKNTQTIYLENKDIGFVDKQSMHAKRNGYSFSYREVNFFRSSMDLLFKEVQEGLGYGTTIAILCGTQSNIKRTKELLAEKINNPSQLEKLIITEGSLTEGFECYDFNLLVISIEELFNTPKKRKRIPNQFKTGETIIFSDLKVGDYIVHRTNGVGQFIGINTIEAAGVTKDYIKIKYQDDGILYVPTSNLDNVKKYIGSGDGVPKLNKLGSKDWAKTKARVKSNLQEIAKDLIELYAKREKSKGFMFSKDTEWQKEFEEKFPYIETNDQLRSIEEMKKDMESERPMDRLLCGDVGYGKTEIALRGAFKACMDQKQVAYLAPTTILASQQYDTFKERMKDYPIRIELLNRFVPTSKQKEIIKGLQLGEVDIVIGTHKLLNDQIQYKNLGLLIIDEEHRFGVKHKEKIKKLKTNIDVLTMTATPIPRTLHMSIVGIRDMSCLYEPPQNRRPVQTYVLEYDKEVVREAIAKELEREGQVFYLYNNVENIDEKANEVSKLVPEAKIAFAHGQMTGREIEDIMEKFVNKEIDVLVCTTILESGIDIPNANTIIVENADRLGLAQLYQIRGRVGRSDRQAYAYITYKRDKIITEVAEKRLKAIKEFTEFGSGFKIAMRDLEIRGAGSLLGEIQHGHMDEVGYDTYCKILDEVIKEQKGIKVAEEPEITIDINISSFIPDSYIESTDQKMESYRNIALCRTEEDFKNIEENLIDRFGKMPEEVINLISIAKLKEMCKNSGIIKVIQKQNNIILYFEPERLTLDVTGLVHKYNEKIKFSTGVTPYITYKVQDPKNLIPEIEELLGNKKSIF